MTITRVWQSGFETGNHEAIYMGGTPGCYTTYAKTGTYALRLRHINVYGDGIRVAIPATRQVRTGFFLLNEGNPYTGSDMVCLKDVSGNKLVSLYWGGYGSEGNLIKLYVGGTSRDTEAAEEYYTWIHIGIDVKIDSSSGWAKVYKNGTEILSYTGNTGNADIINLVSWEAPANGATYWFDNWYIDDTTSEAAAAVVPVKYFYYLTPGSGSPSYNQWDGSDGNSTDNYALIDEVPPSTTDYITTATTDELDSSQMSTFTLAANQTIEALIPIVYVKRNSTTELLAVGTRYSSTDALSADKTPTTAYSYLWERQTTKPGGGAWDQTSMDGVEVLVKSEGTY